jgi:hypothetical protein
LQQLVEVRHSAQLVHSPGVTWLVRSWNWLGLARGVRPPQAQKPWWRRALRVAAWVLVGLELVYVIAVSLFLNFNGLSLAFASTNQVNAKVGSGWSIIPGRVHVRNVRVTFQDHNLQFSIEAARAFVVVRLSELFRHTFHAAELRGEGLSFRMRHRVDPWSKHEPSVGTFPPIPEFPAPAVFEAYVPEPPVSDAAYNMWTVHFDNVDVAVSELWVQAFRYTGKGRARGSFQLKPARKLWVSPASLELEPGLLSAGAYRVLPGLRGRIDCTVHPFDVRVPQGMAVFRDISAHIWLDSPEVEPEVWALFEAGPGPRVSSQGGTLHLNLETRHGVLTPQSRVDLVQRGFELRAPQGDLDAERLELHAGTEGDSSSRVTLLIDRGIVKDPITPGHPPLVERLSATLVSGNRDAAADFNVQEVRLDDARLWLGDSSWLNRWLKGQSFALTGGGASLSARGHYVNKQVTGTALLDSDGVQATLNAKRLRYAGSVVLQGTDVDPEAFTGSVIADITGRSLGAELADGELKVAGLQVHVSASRDQQGHTAHAEAQLASLSTTGSGMTVRAPEVHAVADSVQGPDGAQITRFLAQIPMLNAESPGARLTTAVTARGTFAHQKNKPEQSLELWATLQKPHATFGPAQKATAKHDVALHARLNRDARGALNGKLGLLPADWYVDSGNLRFSGKSALVADFTALDLARNSGLMAARLTSTAVTLGDTTQNANCPWSRAQSVELAGTIRLLERGSSALTMTGELGQIELNWGDFLTRADLAFKASFDQGLVAEDGAGALDLTLSHASLQSGGGGAQGWAAVVPALGLQATLAQKAGKLSGTANLSAAAAKGRIGGTQLSTDFNAAFKLDALDVRARTAHGSGAVHVRNTALPNVPDPVAKWWADINVDSIFGRAESNLELGGTFHAELRDATPGLAVLASQGSLPKWVASALPLRGLSVTGSMARRCRLTDIHVVQMSGGPALARGRLQSVPDGFQGAVLLRLSGLTAISAGLDFDAQHTNFGLFKGDDWLARLNQSFDRKSEAAVNLQCPPDANLCSEPGASSLARTSAR